MRKWFSGTTGMVAAVLLGAVVASAATAGAASLITGKQIKDGSISKKDLTTAVQKQLGRTGARGATGLQGPAGPPGTSGAPGTPGTPGAGIDTVVKKIDYRADAGSGQKDIYATDGFKLEANCLVGSIDVRARSLVDNGAISGSGTGDSGSGVVALYGQDFDFDSGNTLQVNAFTDAEENGTLTYIGPSGQVTTVTYLVNYTFGGHDCVFAGTAVTFP